jgi:hypothetical protein
VGVDHELVGVVVVDIIRHVAGADGQPGQDDEDGQGGDHAAQPPLQRPIEAPPQVAHAAGHEQAAEEAADVLEDVHFLAAEPDLAQQQGAEGDGGDDDE